MTGLAFEDNVQTALADYRFDDSEREAEIFEHRPLLDMKFQVAKRVSSSLADTRRIEPERRNRFPHLRTRGVLPGEQLVAGFANQRKAADEWHAEAHAFFLG